MNPALLERNKTTSVSLAPPALKKDLPSLTSYYSPGIYPPHFFPLLYTTEFIARATETRVATLTNTVALKKPEGCERTITPPMA